MPFVLPEYDQSFSTFIHRLIRELAGAHEPLVGKIRSEPAVGTASSLIQVRGEEALDLPGESLDYGMTMEVSAVREGNFEFLVMEMDKAASELGDKLVGMLIANLGKVTDMTGNVVDAGGQFTFKHFYELLDKIEWSLDENDELSMPSLIMHPDTVKELPKLSPQQEASLGQLKMRKREELLARRRRRRLS